MRSATVRQLRHDFGSVLHWVEEGEEVEISKRGLVVARLTPVTPKKRKRGKMPDFMARLRKRDGGRVIPASALHGIIDDSRGNA